MKAKNDPLGDLLHSSHELETFFHEFIMHVARQRPRPGADVTKYSRKLGVAVPGVLKGAKITWAHHGDADAAGEDGPGILVFTRPGQPEALGFTIGCVKVGRYKVCLECGWLYCRIVIKGRF